MARRDDAEGFLARWSRRKRTASDTARPATGQPAGTENPLAPATSDDATRDETAGDETANDAVTGVAGHDHAVPEDLPDPGTLTLDSDFTPFMREGVPAPLRQAALRRLWRLDPVFANRDGLAEYDHDYRALHAAVKEVVTSYRIGRGMPTPDPAPPPDPALPADPATAPDRDPGQAAAAPEADPPAADSSAADSSAADPTSPDPTSPDPTRAGIDGLPSMPAGSALVPSVIAGAAPDLPPPIRPPKRRRGRAARQNLPGIDPD